MQRLGVGGCVSVEDVAVLDGVRLPRPLVFGEVPARGELRLQRLWTARQSDRWTLIKGRISPHG